MTKKVGRPPKPERKKQIVTWVKLPLEYRQKLNADFGSFQAGLFELARRYCERGQDE